ncbi:MULTISPECIES: recombinase family protein [unclassified Mucilaginibacter]|uniref:recombinase family protein n=1 Tax=unclassified Mucilaginibacter TaxID=2617802 RepID=UPI002AC99E5B|nr:MULTISPECIES: recombinase family protein [unclassified Mucilaginibacter]MEB0263463.1 recombinase family protein [Mucilaginibacter sp. 10I4]MEB0302388.1 recombinase family protein [Mucilaginibacter sp. 5C4]WPX25690.1 recombinase family protein [Mucilaginibacter sp. 5C4]
MNSAYLYVRVSTDEQKRKGYSLPEQEDRLLRYCEQNNIEVKGIFREDYSAKNFNRPEWTKMLTIVKARKKKDQENILFIKWDRFSRNIEFAYQMIGILRGINVQAMAIDQPIDFKIPESTVMLAVYLAVPESENTRRALNTLTGMRRARKAGRCVSTAPKGYINLSHADGRKYIAPKQPEASIMQWVFKELATGTHNAEQVRKMAKTQGLACERNNFWKIIRNPIYCGIIVVPPYEDEEIQFVKAQHEPIITEALFYEVQDVLNGNKKKPTTKFVSSEMLPLRGFLECPDCHRMLTGSASRGRHGNYFHYYHCAGSCKCRFKAATVNEYFENELLNFKLSPAIADHFKAIVVDVFKAERAGGSNERLVLAEQIDQQEKILSNARRRFMTEDIDAEDFKAIKGECTALLRVLEAKLADMPSNGDSLKTVEGLLDIVIQKYSDIHVHYKSAGIIEKRKLIGSIYPKNLCFDGIGYRTPHLNTALGLILQINSQLSCIKKGERYTNLHLSPLVARRGIEPLFLE